MSGNPTEDAAAGADAPAPGAPEVEPQADIAPVPTVDAELVSDASSVADGSATSADGGAID